MNFIFISPNFPKIYSRFVKALKERGINVLGIGDEPFHQLNDELKNNLIEYCHVQDLNNVQWVEDTIRYLNNKYGKIDFIESNNEYWLRNDAHYREVFNVENGYRPQELAIFQSKSGMKKFFKEAGVKTARYIIVSSLEESKKFVNEVGYPVFAKPDTGVGAADTFKIKNEDDLIRFHSLNLNETYIMEEFINGYIVSFDGIANKECDVTVCFKETFPTPIAEVVENDSDVYYFAQSKLDKEYREMGQRIVKAFKASQRCFHTELFLLKEDKPGLAKKGEIIGLEINLRSPGGESPELLNLVSKNDYYETYAEMIVNNVSNLDNETDYYSVSANRKYNLSYKHSHDEILEKYHDYMVKDGEYSLAFRNALGDHYYIAKFDSLDKLQEFVEFVTDK